MIGDLPQFSGVNAPHLAIGVQPWFVLESITHVWVFVNYIQVVYKLAARESGVSPTKRGTSTVTANVC